MVLSFSISAAHAADKKSFFDQLIEWSEQGEPVSFEDVRGYYRGRCSQFIVPDRSYSSVLAVDTIFANGPAFPGEDQVMALTFPKEQKVADVRRAVLAQRKYYTPARIENGQLVNEWDMEANGRNDQKNYLRRFQNYLIATSEELVGQKYYSTTYEKEFFAKKGQIVDACYFYEKLTE